MNESSNKYLIDDTELYYLGTFDTQLGVIKSIDKPEFVCKFVDSEAGVE